MEEDSVKFSSKGDAGNHRETRMGSYKKTSQMVKGCPVFEQVDKHEEEKQYFLFVGPDGRWRVGPDVTSYSGSVLKHPKKNTRLPPKSGWLYYLDDKWKDAESLRLTVNMKDVRDEDEIVKFASKGDAEIHRKTRMGSYKKTSQMVKGCPVFEQVDQHQDEEQYFLFVGPDGRWRVGPDVTSYSGSVLKHPQKNAAMPPKTGWVYYLDDSWHEDKSLHLMKNTEAKGVANAKLKNDPSCDTIVEEVYEIEEGYRTIEFKHVTSLGMAILKNDLKGVEISLENGCNVNFDKTTDEYDKPMTPLIMACHWSTISVVSLLVQQPGIDLDWRNDDGETALGWAVRKSENLDMVKLLVEAGAKIYLRDGNGFSPLHRAVEAVEEGEKEKEEGALEIVKYLHSKGASINTHGTGRITPFYSAVSAQNLPMIRYLVENGAKINSPKDLWCGFTPFHEAVKKGNVEIVELLIEKGADVTLEGDSEYYGKTVFEIAQKEIDNAKYDYEIEYKKEKYGKIIDMLKAAEEASKINNAAKDVENIVEEFKVAEGGPTYRNISCLGIAVLENNIDEVKISLENGCDINFYKTERDVGCSNLVGWTPLILACEHSSLDIVKLLVEAPGVDLDSTNQEEAALHRAVRRDDNLDMVKLLVEAGADPDLRDKLGFSPLHRAAYCGLHQSEQHIVDYIKYLQSKGAWINTQDNGLTTPLWLAAYHGNPEIVKYLASQGATLDTPHAYYGYFPLNAAVAKANVEVVKVLVELGADVNKESTALGDRTRSSLEIAKKGIDDSTFEREKIPLYQEIISILQEAGAKGPGKEVFNQFILETLEAIMWIWAEKIDVISLPFSFSFWDWPNNSKKPQCMDKLSVLSEDHGQWLTMMEALVDVVLMEHPLGPIAIALLIRDSQMPVDFNPTNVDTYLKVLEMAKSFAPDDIRHRNISIIISCIAGVIKRFWVSAFAIELCQLVLTTDMLDYLFGNLKPGSNPEAAIFSLLALEFLADEKQNGENPCGQIVRNRFMELSPEDHPLIRLEKLVASANLTEKQAGFCAQWYLDNLWTIDNPGARYGKMDNANINANLTACKTSKYLKIGPSGLEVRCDGPWFETAKSSVKVDEGIWYYEVTIITGGLMQIGWATKQSEFLESKGYGVGDDEFSQSYDGCRQVVWYNLLQPKDQHPNGWENQKSKINSWKPGDVVGSLIDIENQEIVFSLNGVSIVNEPYKDIFEKVQDGFFAAVSLMSFQQCQVNFGNDPFKHPPQEKTFRPLNEATMKNE